MGYKMKGFSGFGNSPAKQKERKNWENYGKGEGADVVKKSGLGPRETPGYTDLETTKPGQLMAWDFEGEMKKHVTKKMADKKVKTAYSTLKPKKKSGPLKQKPKHAMKAIKEVKTPDTGFEGIDKAKMRTQREIYKAKLRGDYIDLQGKSVEEWGEILKKHGITEPKWYKDTKTVVDKKKSGPLKQKDEHVEAKGGTAAMLTKKFPKELGKYSYEKYLKEAFKKSKDPYGKDVMSKKGFEGARKAAKSTKWKGLQSKLPKGWDVKPKTATRYYKPELAHKTLKAFSTTPKQLAKGITAKGTAKAVSRAIPVIGEALMTYDVLKEGVKRVAKGIKTGEPQTRLYKKGEEPKGYKGKTWAERKKESKSNVWKKNK